jgi:hypothetical protein
MLGCQYCERLFGHNYNTGIIIPWTFDMEKFYQRRADFEKRFNIKP